MRELEIILCPLCAEVYRTGYRLMEIDSGAMEKRKCEQCGQRGYLPMYRVEIRKGEAHEI